MNYETFNEAMCKLKQAEEEFHKKLQEAFKPFIDEINRIDRETEMLEEYCPGDEIICVNASCNNFNKKSIYLGKSGYRIALCRLEDGEKHFTNSLKNYRKTGQHYNVSM